MRTKQGKVLFIIHDNYQDDNIFPLGPAYLAAILRRTGSEVCTFCMDVFHYSNEELATYLDENEFDLICLGFMAARFKRTVETLCHVINEYKKKAWFVLGGHGPTPIPEYILRNTKADFIALGEAEETIVELLQCKLEKSGKEKQILGVACRVNDEIVINQRRKPVINIDTLPFPAWDLFPMDHYTCSLKFSGMKEYEKSFSVVTTRGCVNKCSFCYRLEKGIRVRSPQNIIDEVKILYQKYGVDYIYFSDELSVTSKKQIAEFARLIQKHKLHIKYRMECRVDLFDEEIAKILKDSGCVFLNIGFESTDQKVLDLLKKNVTVEQNIRAAEIAKQFDIGVGLNFIWGLPGDSEKSLKDNAAFIKKYNHYDQIRTIRPVTPYPGTPLYYEAIEKGLITGPDDFFARFKNADKYIINFMGIPENEIYHMLFEVNRDLIFDHFQHTNGTTEDANRLADNFYRLYFEDNAQFSGPRHYIKS
jgi:anaerobic magnesium-protoporphyrin IX monomethyl ester cyclase